MILYFGLIFACNKPAVTPQVSPDTTPPPVVQPCTHLRPQINSSIVISDGMPCRTAGAAVRAAHNRPRSSRFSTYLAA